MTNMCYAKSYSHMVFHIIILIPNLDYMYGSKKVFEKAKNFLNSRCILGVGGT